MWYRLEQIGNWVGGAIVIGGLILIARAYPITIAVLVLVPTLGILMFTAWYDYDYWKRKYLCWRHRDVLSAAATIVTSHLDQLARKMGEVLTWDGRWDYDWKPWITQSREFVETIVIPALSAEHQRIVSDCGPILREEIRSEASGRVFGRAQQLGLVT